MTLKEYSKIIKQTAIYPKEIGLIYCTLGLCGEAGEVSEKVKKIYRDNNGIINDETKRLLIKELGDVLWYITAASNELGSSLEEVAKINIEKLLARRQTNTLHGNGDDREIMSNN
ncbi:MAG: nucleoside triphosphate pyrophosphohydrolase family protein [Candidatus Woesearchaeota archaeon]